MRLPLLPLLAALASNPTLAGTPAAKPAPSAAKAPAAPSAPAPSANAAPADASASGPSADKAAADEAPAPKAPGKATVPAGWVPLVVKESGFQAAFPGTPTKEDSTQDTEAGTAKTTTWAVEPRKQAYFAVSVTVFPEKTVSMQLPSEVLEGARDGAVANVNGTLVSDRSLFVNAPPGAKQRLYPAREFELIGPQGIQMGARVIVVGDRLYQIIQVRVSDSNEEFKKLAGSFQLL